MLNLVQNKKRSTAGRENANHSLLIKKFSNLKLIKLSGKEIESIFVLSILDETSSA
jgi:hypothetical protein